MKKNKTEIFWTFSNSERSRTLKTLAEHSYFLVLKHRNCTCEIFNKRIYLKKFRVIKKFVFEKFRKLFSENIFSIIRRKFFSRKKLIFFFAQKDLFFANWFFEKSNEKNYKRKFSRQKIIRENVFPINSYNNRSLAVI